jgi:DNA-binding beta-propeller fold protein YncE
MHSRAFLEIIFLPSPNVNLENKFVIGSKVKTGSYLRNISNSSEKQSFFISSKNQILCLSARIWVVKKKKKKMLSIWVELLVVVSSVMMMTLAQAQSHTFPVGNYPHGITIDLSDNAWTTLRGHSIIKLSNSGEKLGVFKVGSDPQGLAVDKENNVWWRITMAIMR